MSLAVVGITAAPAEARAGSAYQPGAPGVGDEYFPLSGNGGYDVQHYALKVSYNPATNRLVGEATIRARANQNLSRFNLDLVGLTVRSVTINRRSASWSRTDHELQITPRRGLREGSGFTAVIRYDGVPVTSDLVIGPDFSIPSGFIHTDDGVVIAGQPEVAATWYPVNDHPIDKASYTFTVTAPADLEVVANGRLVQNTRHGRARTWVWDAPEPMASYLTTVNIGEFDTRQYRTPDGLWMYDAIDPDLFNQRVNIDDAASPTLGGIAQGSLGRQGEILDFLEQQFGPYPFSTGGGIVDDYDDLYFALETQTRPVYSKYFFFTPEGGDSVVVHELAHQWFGDSVALAEWQHIWLNEGFATYAEWLWREDQGLGTAQEIFDQYYAIPADDPFWSVVIGDPGAELLFDGAVYNRGAMAVHALRQEVGDEDFFRIMRTWTRLKAGGNATTSQFIRLAEQVSREQLDGLFQTWLYTGRKPAPGLVTANETTISPRSQDPRGPLVADRLLRK